MKNVITILLISICSISIGIAQNIHDSLIVYYPFDGDAVDHSGNGFNGVVSGATLTTDRNGNPNSAYYFDGVNDFILLPNIPALKPALPVTFAFWVKIKSLAMASNKFIATDHQYNNYAGFWITTLNTGEVQVSFGGCTGGATEAHRRTKISSSKLTIGTWHYITCVVRGALDMNIYIDCIDAGGTYSGSGSTNLAYSSNSGKIGSEPANSISPTSYFWGTMDEFAFWNRALGTFEIERLCVANPLNIGSESPLNASVVNKLYPNPFTENTTIELNYSKPQELTLYVYDIYGKQIKSKSIDSEIVNFDRGSLSSGMYFYQIKNDEKNILGSGKLIVQ